MCKPTKDGYEMDDGVVVPYTADISEIKPQYIETLNTEKATAWDSFLLHREQKDIQTNLTNMEARIIKKIDTVKSVHFETCPLNVAGIGQLIESKVNEMADNGLGDKIRDAAVDAFKGTTVKVYSGFKSVIRDIILIAAGAGAVFGLAKAFGL